MSVPARLEPVAFTLLRIVTGLLFAFHGLQKLGLLDDRAMIALTSLRGIAAILETVGGPLISFGLFTRPVAFILSGEMAYAYFSSHQPRGLWPIGNGGEPSVLFCFIFLYFATRGAGRWSIDGARSAKP